MENPDVFFQDENGKIPCVTARVTLSYKSGKAENVCIQFNLPHNLYIENNPIHLNNLQGGSTPYNETIKIFCLNHEIPFSNKIEMNVSYSDYNSSSK
jgi:hypothetical protein